MFGFIFKKKKIYSNIVMKGVFQNKVLHFMYSHGTQIWQISQITKSCLKTNKQQQQKKKLVWCNHYKTFFYTMEL